MKPPPSRGQAVDEDQYDPPARLGEQGESASSTRSRRANGRPRLSSPPCATTASTRPARSTGPSTASASTPMSNSSLSRRSSRATSILDNLGSHKGKAVRKAIRDVGARLVFPNTRPTSIRSSRSSPSSRLCCEKPKPEHTLSPTQAQPSSPIPARRMRRLCEERRIRVDPKAGRSRLCGLLSHP